MQHSQFSGRAQAALLGLALVVAGVAPMSAGCGGSWVSSAARWSIRRCESRRGEWGGKRRAAAQRANSSSALTTLMSWAVKPSGKDSIFLSSARTAVGLGVGYLIGEGWPEMRAALSAFASAVTKA